MLKKEERQSDIAGAVGKVFFFSTSIVEESFAT